MKVARLRIDRANPEHLAILNTGGDSWNRWRTANLDLHPDFQGANLNKADFSSANLTGANLTKADLSSAGLIQATLIETDLTEANLKDAICRQLSLCERS